MTNHSNVQVGEVIQSYRDSSGKLWKTEVDDVGFFVVITPFVGWIEKPNKLPLSISDVYSKNLQPNIGGGEKGMPSPAMHKDTNL